MIFFEIYIGIGLILLSVALQQSFVADAYSEVFNRDWKGKAAVILALMIFVTGWPILLMVVYGQ